MSMPIWEERFIAVWDQLVTIVKGIKMPGTTTPIFNPDYVYYGEKYEVDNWPSAYICPLPIDIISITFHAAFNEYLFDIAVVVKNEDPKQGILDGISTVGKIYDAIVADPQLNKKACKTECLRIDPNWRGKSTGIEQFWVALSIKVTTYGT